LRFLTELRVLPNLPRPPTFERSRRYAEVEAEKIPLRFLRNLRDAENVGGANGEGGEIGRNRGNERLGGIG